MDAFTDAVRAVLIIILIPDDFSTRLRSMILFLGWISGTLAFC